MKWQNILFILFTTGLVFTAGCVGPQSVTIEELEENPDQYLDKTVTLEVRVALADTQYHQFYPQVPDGAAQGTHLWLYNPEYGTSFNTVERTNEVSAWYKGNLTEDPLNDLSGKEVKIIGKFIRNPIIQSQDQYWKYWPAAELLILIEELEIIA